ncbi:mobilization protein, partial [Acinetobacter baumannii]
ANTEPRTTSPESSGTEKTYHFEYGTDFSSSYFAYSNFLAWSRHQKQVQRDADAKYRDQREANEGRPFEPIGRQFDDQHMQATRQQSTAPM